MTLVASARAARLHNRSAKPGYRTQLRPRSYSAQSLAASVRPHVGGDAQRRGRARENARTVHSLAHTHVTPRGDTPGLIPDKGKSPKDASATLTQGVRAAIAHARAQARHTTRLSDETNGAASAIIDAAALATHAIALGTDLNALAAPGAHCKSNVSRGTATSELNAHPSLRVKCSNMSSNSTKHKV